MKKTLVMVVASLVLTMFFLKELSSAGDYYVPWTQLQKRTYENGNTFNRLGFGVTDGYGSYVPNNVVKSVSLEGPGGPISLPPFTLYTYENIYGRLMPDSGLWSYDAQFVFENYYGVNFGGNLVPGFYTITIVDIDDVTIFNESVYFNGVVELPEISSKSFRGYEDSSGNLIWQWDVPTDTNLWVSNPDTSARCWVTIYSGNSYIGEIYVRVPTTTGMMFVPSNVMNMAKQKGDNFRVAMHIRTNDNNNRYYTNAVPFSSLKKELRKVVVVPLN